MTATLDATHASRTIPATILMSARTAPSTRCTTCLPKSVTNSEMTPLTSAKIPSSCAMTTENKYGDPMAKNPTTSERMPEKISQPRLCESAWAGWREDVSLVAMC